MSLQLTRPNQPIPAAQAKVHVNGTVQAIYLQKGVKLAAIRDDVTFIDYIIPAHERMYKGLRVTIDGYIRSTDAHSINVSVTSMELDLEA